MYTEYIKYFLPALLAFLLSAAIIPIVSLLSEKYNLYDNSDYRKIHTGQVSRIGGAAVFLSFLIIAILILPSYNFKFNIFLYFLAAFMAFAIGFLDDIWEYSAKIRLLLQFICAGIAVSSGIMFENINLFGIVEIKFGLITVVVSIFMIVLFMNAVNLIDGMDGLSAGILLTANLFICVLGFLSNNPVMIIISLIICGALSCFFIYNFPPAKIFLGDGGAYFLGFTCATFPVIGAESADSTSALFIFPFILMILPVTDLIYVAVMRIKSGKSVFKADKTHLHYRLMRLGLSNCKILFLFMGFTAGCGLVSVLMYLSEALFSLILLFSIFFIIGILFYILKKSERKLESISHLNQHADID